MRSEQHCLVERLHCRLRDAGQRSVNREPIASLTVGCEQEPEQSLSQQDVVGHHGHEVGCPYADAHGRLACPRPARGGSTLKHFFQSEDGRRRKLSGNAVRLEVDGAFDEQLDRLGSALPPHFLPRRVTDLLARLDSPEQVVNRHELEDRCTTQTIHQFDRREPATRSARAVSAGASRENPRRRVAHARVRARPVHIDPLQIIGQAGRSVAGRVVDGRGCDNRVAVVNQLRQRVLEIARPRLEQPIGVVDLDRHRRLVDERHDALAHVRPEQVVQVLDRVGATLPVAACDRAASRGDVTDLIQHAQQPVDPIEDSLEAFSERAFQQRGVRARRVLADVASQRQDVAVEIRLLQQQRLYSRGRSHQRGVLASDGLDCGNDLVAQEAVSLVEAADERVHRSLAGKQGQRRRDVSLHPDVLVRVLKRVPQGRDNLVTEPDESLAREVLQGAMPESRYQARQEQPVGNTHGARTPDGFDHDVRVVVVQ